MLSGEGADEALGGYYIYRRMAQLEALRRRLGAGAGALALAGSLFSRLPHDKLRRAGAPARPPAREHLPRRVARLRRRRPRALLQPNGRAGDADEIVDSLLAPHWEPTRGMSPLRRMLYLDSRVWLPDDLLVKADKMTMAHAIELRVPFLDHELIEHAWSLPDHLKIHGGVGKALLRKAAARPRAAGDPRPPEDGLRHADRRLAARRPARARRTTSLTDSALARARALRPRLRARAAASATTRGDDLLGRAVAARRARAVAVELRRRPVPEPIQEVA